MVFYICDRKKCKRCSGECLHTSDYKHAKYKEIISKDLSKTFRHDENGNLWEKEKGYILSNVVVTKKGEDDGKQE